MNQRPDPKARASVSRVLSRDLLGERGEIIIEHNGREYRLRLTQSGKLILTA
jgi:hemin uptake protein HemP